MIGKGVSMEEVGRTMTLPVRVPPLVVENRVITLPEMVIVAFRVTTGFEVEFAVGKGGRRVDAGSTMELAVVKLVLDISVESRRLDVFVIVDEAVRVEFDVGNGGATVAEDSSDDKVCVASATDVCKPVSLLLEDDTGIVFAWDVQVVFDTAPVGHRVIVAPPLTVTTEAVRLPVGGL